jgi:hypothetical protein
MINAITDISSLYRDDLKKAESGFAIIDNKYVMVRDEVEASGKDAVITWDMLTSANARIICKNTAELAKNGKKLIHPRLPWERGTGGGEANCFIKNIS